MIHARDPDGETGAVDDVFEILDANAGDVPVILHCFLAPWRVDDAIERGWYCSFSGIVTYPKSDELRAAAAKLPESWSWSRPTLPTWRRSRCGEAERARARRRHREGVAEARGESYEELERSVEANARRLFGW